MFYVEQLQPNWLPQRQRLFYQGSVALIVGLICYLLFWPVVTLLNGPVFGLLAALGIGLAGGLYVGVLIGLKDEIEPAEVLTWTWKDARGIVAAALGVRLLFGLGVGLRAGLREGLTTAALLFDRVEAREKEPLLDLTQHQIGLEVCGDLL